MKSRRFIESLPWGRRTLEFAFGFQPIIQLTTWEAATLKMDFIRAEPDFFAAWCVVCGSVFCVGLNGV
jgi:hypothetical protein